MSLGNVGRVVLVVAACVAALGSASSTRQSQTVAPPQAASPSPPLWHPLEPIRALGSWSSTFGPVTIEPDEARGGIKSGAVRGVWVHRREGGGEVTGHFEGSLRGNVLEFRFNEPTLSGAGYLVFEDSGLQYSGRWWSDKRDRDGEWNGWRQASALPSPGAPSKTRDAAEAAPEGCAQKRQTFLARAEQKFRNALGPTPDPELQEAAERELAKWRAGFLAACEEMGDRLDPACFSADLISDRHCREVMRELGRRVGFD